MRQVRRVRRVRRACLAWLLGLAAGRSAASGKAVARHRHCSPRRIPLRLQRACNACLPPRRDMGRSKDGVNLSDDKIGDLVSSWISSPGPEPQP